MPARTVTAPAVSQICFRRSERTLAIVVIAMMALLTSAAMAQDVKARVTFGLPETGTVLAEKYPGPMAIKSDTIFNGMVEGDVSVEPGATLHLQGMVTEQLTVRAGGRALVYGAVGGNVFNKGGHVEVTGVIGGVSTTEGGTSIVASTTIVIPATQSAIAGANPLQAAQRVATLDQFYTAPEVVKEVWTLYILDQVMLMDSVNEFIIRPVRTEFARDLQNCLEVRDESEEGTSLTEKATKCTVNLAVKRVHYLKKNDPDAVTEYKKRIGNSATGKPTSQDAFSTTKSSSAVPMTLAEQSVTTPDGKKVLLRDDGTYVYENQKAEDYEDISVLDLKVDLKDINGKLVRTKGKGIYFGDALILTDPQVEFDMNGITVSLDKLPRDTRKWIVGNCEDGCTITVEGEVNTDGFIPTLAAHAVTGR